MEEPDTERERVSKAEEPQKPAGLWHLIRGRRGRIARSLFVSEYPIDPTK